MNDFPEIYKSAKKTLKSFGLTAEEFLELLTFGEQCSGLDDELRFACGDIICGQCPIHYRRTEKDIRTWLNSAKRPSPPPCKPPAPTKNVLEERIEKLEEQNEKIINMLEQILGLKEIQ